MLYYRPAGLRARVGRAAGGPERPATFPLRHGADIMTFEEIRRLVGERDTFARHMGMELVEAGRERAVVSMPFDERHRNAMGNAHGGAVFALADLAFAAASCAAGYFCVNAQTSISYVAPGVAGPLRAEARPVHLGRRLVTYEVKVFDGNGVMTALATVTGYSKSAPAEV